MELAIEFLLLRRNHSTSIMKVFQIIALSALAVVLLTSTAGRSTSSLSFLSSALCLCPYWLPWHL